MTQRYVLNTKAFKDLIKERNVSIRFMARWFDVTPSYISMLLNNRKSISLHWFCSLISFLHIELSKINDYVNIEEVTP